MTMAADRSNSPSGDDPFQRALAREEAYRQKRSRRDVFGFPAQLFRTFKWLGLGALLAWAGLLAIHWLLLREPRWLAVLHTMVYGLALIYVGTALTAFSIMRRNPAAFGLVPEDE